MEHCCSVKRTRREKREEVSAAVGAVEGLGAGESLIAVSGLTGSHI